MMTRGGFLMFVLIGVLVACTTFVSQPAFAVDGAAQASSFINNITKALIGIAGVIAFLFVVWGAIKYASSSGNPDRLEKAKSTILYALLGLVIALAAFSIVDWVTGLAKTSFGA